MEEGTSVGQATATGRLLGKALSGGVVPWRKAMVWRDDNGGGGQGAHAAVEEDVELLGEPEVVPAPCPRRRGAGAAAPSPTRVPFHQVHTMPAGSGRVEGQKKFANGALKKNWENEIL